MTRMTNPSDRTIEATVNGGADHTADRRLHIAPDPNGGWLIEPSDRALAPSSYGSLDSAIDAAQAFAIRHRDWQIVVHDEHNPIAGPAGA